MMSFSVPAFLAENDILGIFRDLRSNVNIVGSTVELCMLFGHFGIGMQSFTNSCLYCFRHISRFHNALYLVPDLVPKSGTK